MDKRHRRFAKHQFYSDWKKESNSLGVESSIDRVQKILDNIITTFRLLKPGAVGYSCIECKDTLNIPVKVGYYYSRGPFRVFGEDIYWLNRTDIAYIQQLYSDLKNIESSRNLSLFLALERFNSAYSDYSLEDKIIDFAISYEVLLSKQQEGTDSVNHKLAVRCSRLVTEDYEQRSIYQYLTIRS